MALFSDPLTDFSRTTHHVSFVKSLALFQVAQFLPMTAFKLYPVLFRSWNLAIPCMLFCSEIVYISHGDCRPFLREISWIVIEPAIIPSRLFLSPRIPRHVYICQLNSSIDPEFSSSMAAYWMRATVTRLGALHPIDKNSMLHAFQKTMTRLSIIDAPPIIVRSPKFPYIR